MDLLNILLEQGGGQSVQQLAKNFGLNQTQTAAAVSNLLPILGQALARNASSQGGLESLLGALTGGNHRRYLEDPSLMTQEETRLDGNGILGHILGSKDVSRQVARQTSERTGIGVDVVKKMLPMVAALAMGALGRQTSSIQGAAPAGSDAGGLAGMMGQFLDSNRDGSVADDLLGLAARLFQK